MHPSPAAERVPGLDVLRLVAVVLVFGHHIGEPPADCPPLLRTLLLAWHRGGWVGVDIFFVLSGFLVSGLLFAEYRSSGDISPRRFYIRRFWKIYPPLLYLNLLAATGSLAAGAPVGRALIGELFFLQNYVGQFFVHTWSLAVEEHFYLLLPVALGLMLRRNHGPDPFRAVPWVALGVGVASLALRALNSAMRDEFSQATHLFPTHLRMDSLWFGVALGYVYHFHRDQLTRWTAFRHWLVAGGLLLFVPAFVFPRETPAIHVVGLTAWQAASGALLVAVLLSPWSPRLAPLARIGASSYSIYLWHVPVLFWMMPLIPGSWDTATGYGVRLILALAGSVAVGMWMARMIERPALRLRDRLWPDARLEHTRRHGQDLRIGRAAGGADVPESATGH